MAMKGYVLMSNGGLSLPTQKAALRHLGVDAAPGADQLFKDDMRQRVKIARRVGDELHARRVVISALVAGDVLAIASPACLGMSAQDIRLTLKDILGRHIDLLVASPRLRVRAGDQEAIDAYLERATMERRAIDATWMRSARVSPGLKGGRRRIDFDEDRARAMWANSDYASEEVAAAVGVGVRTLFRRLGPRVFKPLA